MDIEKSSRVMHSIASITSYIQENGGHPAQEGIVLLALEYPELRLVKGEVDLVVLTAEEFHEDQTITYSAGWIGGGEVMSAWLEDDEGTVIDPWLHERIAGGFPEGKLAQLPVMFATRNYAGPIGICYGRGRFIPIDGAEDLHSKYLAWLETWDIKTAVYPYARYILDEEGVEKHADTFAWANAVKTIDEREGSPYRKRKIEEDKPNDLAKKASQPLATVKVDALGSLEILQKKHKISPIKTVLAAVLGAAAGGLFLWIS